MLVMLLSRNSNPFIDLYRPYNFLLNLKSSVIVFHINLSLLFFADTMRLLLISLALLFRYKVGRIEQMESANQAKARGSNAVSVKHYNEPQFLLALSVVLILRPLASGKSKHHVYTFLEYAFPPLHVQNYLVIVLE